MIGSSILFSRWAVEQIRDEMEDSGFLLFDIANAALHRVSLTSRYHLNSVYLELSNSFLPSLECLPVCRQSQRVRSSSESRNLQF